VAEAESVTATRRPQEEAEDVQQIILTASRSIEADAPSLELRP
jgi:hypothetical protein